MNEEDSATCATTDVLTPCRLPLFHDGYQLKASHKLCWQCENIFVQVQLDLLDRVELDPSFYPEFEGKHHQTFRQLRSSASECHLCDIAYTIAAAAAERRYGGSWLSEPVSWEMRRWPATLPLAWILKFTVGEHAYAAEFTGRRSDEPLPPSAECRSTGSMESLQLAQAWLSECISGHSECVPTSTVNWIPSRLVYVGHSNQRQPPRLCLRSEIIPGTQYLTLSHCWGKGPLTKVTLATISQFRQLIPPSALPKTFVDAFEITRSLGYEYLWIDSLCIVQDCEEDWKNECAVMGKIYQNGLCNIAAAVGDDSSAGCFSERNPSILQPLVVRTRSSGSREDLQTYNNAWMFSEGVNCTSRPGFLIESSTLLSRGWVIQEVFLARRILYFTQEQVIWACASGCASESHPHLGSVHASAWGLNKFNEEDLASYPCIQQFDIWNQAVEMYSNTSLTRINDRLPALAGIAKFMGSLLWEEDDDVAYLAGLWSKYLVQQLLWFTIVPVMRIHGQAPSWSWASTDGNFQPAMPREELENGLLFDLIDAKTFPCGKDPFQQVKGGQIRGRGWLWKFPSPPPCHHWEHPYQVPQLREFSFWYDEIQDTLDETLYFLPLLCWKLPDLLGFKGLALRKAERHKTIYRRIGYFDLAVAHPPYTALEGLGPRLVAQRSLWWLSRLFRQFGGSRLDGNDFEERINDERFGTRNVPYYGKYIYTITIV